MTQSAYPYFSFFPALPLSKGIRLGDWCIGKPSEQVQWRSQRFKELALAYVAAFINKGFKDGALMWHYQRGFDGSMPEPQVWSAIRATMCFIMLDANDQVRTDPNAGHYMTTSENAELYTQPIDEKKEYITHRRGGLLREVMSIGAKIGAGVVPPLPDAVVAVSQPVAVSQHLATALFEAILDPSKQDNRRIGIALEWHRFALSNPIVVSWPQRLISLKTAFEALSGESKTHQCARFLRQLFESTTRPHVDRLPWPGILWSPRESTNLHRTWMQNGVPQPVVRSELEEWFHALGSARNEIIHEGTLTTAVYQAPTERPLSRYAGPIFWTADRLVREAVKAMLGVEVLLCGLIKDVEAWRQFLAAGVSNAEEIDVHTDPETVPLKPNAMSAEDCDASIEEEESPAQAHRSLKMLLSELECDAANKVLLEKIVAYSSPTIEGAVENARSVKGCWSASFGEISIRISKAERDLLETAGAEFALSLHWTQCE